MSTTIDQQFIEYIVKSLVGNPDAVEIKRTIDEKGVLLELTVDPQDLGRVIGKRGAGAQALRTLLRALGTKNDARYNLKIVDNGEPRPERPPREDRVPALAEDADVTDAPKEELHKDEASAESSSAEATEDKEPVADVEEMESSSVADRTRKELADLDDLDI